MPDNNDYEGLSQEEIAAIMDDNKDAGDDVSSLKEEQSQATDNDNADDNKEDENNRKDDKFNEPNDEQQSDEPKSKAFDANNSQKSDEVPNQKDEDSAKEAESDTNNVSKEMDSKPLPEDGAKEQKPFVSTFPEVDAAKLEELKAKLDEAQKQFSDGDIDYAELDIIKDAYNELKWKAEFTESSNLNTRETLWKWEQDRFLDDNVKFKDNTTLNAAFVAVVNGIIATEDGAKLTDRQVLAKAKEQVEVDLGLIVKDSRDKAKTEEEKKQAAIAAAKKANADTSNLAADIGGLPAAEENTDVSPFAFLDKLEGEKYQAAIDKLSPEQLRQYEDSA